MPQSSLFVDTSGWADPILQNTPHFALMRTFSEDLIKSQHPLTTTNLVLIELLTLLTARSRLERPRILEFLKGIRAMPQLTLIRVEAEVEESAWAMLERYDDKTWSLVDATSFVVMRTLGVSDAFTTDQHFSQAGFRRLPEGL